MPWHPREEEERDGGMVAWGGGYFPPSSVHYSISFGLTLLCLPCFRRTELGKERLKIGGIGSGLK